MSSRIKVKEYIEQLEAGRDVFIGNAKVCQDKIDELTRHVFADSNAYIECVEWSQMPLVLAGIYTISADGE